MRLFFRIVLATSITLLLILKVSQFVYLKFIDFPDNFNLLPTNYDYAFSINQDNTQQLQQNKTLYNLLNAPRLVAKQKYKVLNVHKPQFLFASIQCDNQQQSYLTVLPSLKPSQIQVSSQHEMAYLNNSIYIYDVGCNFATNPDTSTFKHLKHNVAKSKYAYIVFNKDYVNNLQSFIPLSSDYLVSLKFKHKDIFLNGFAGHDKSSLSKLSGSLSKQDLSCLGSSQLDSETKGASLGITNYLAIKDPFLFLEGSNLLQQEFANNFQDNLQISFQPEFYLCNQSQKFELKDNIELNTYSKELPDSSAARYYDLDLAAIFSKALDELGESKQGRLETKLLAISDVFVEVEVLNLKTHNYFNFLADSFNSVTYIHE